MSSGGPLYDNQVPCPRNGTTKWAPQGEIFCVGNPTPEGFMGELVRAPCPHPGSLMGAGRAGQERQVSCGLGLGLWGSQARARRSGRTGPFAATAACQTSHSQPPRHELPPHPRPAPAPVPTCVSNLTKLPSSTTRRKGRTGLVQPGSPGHPRPLLQVGQVPSL